MAEPIGVDDVLDEIITEAKRDNKPTMALRAVIWGMRQDLIDEIKADPKAGQALLELVTRVVEAGDAAALQAAVDDEMMDSRGG